MTVEISEAMEWPRPLISVVSLRRRDGDVEIHRLALNALQRQTVVHAYKRCHKKQDLEFLSIFPLSSLLNQKFSMFFSHSALKTQASFRLCDVNFEFTAIVKFISGSSAQCPNHTYIHKNTEHRETP